MPYQERQRDYGHEMVEITSPEMAKDIVHNLALRRRLSVEQREDLRRMADKIEKEQGEGKG